MAAAVERFWASREARHASCSLKVHVVSAIPARVVAEVRSRVASFFCRKEKQPFVFGSRQIDRMLVGSGFRVPNPLLHVAEGDQPHLGLYVRLHAVPEGCHMP